MFPIGDDDTQRRTFPVVTYALIALNVAVFLANSVVATNSSTNGHLSPHDFVQSPLPMR
jgi:rhomboid family protein